MTIGLDTPDCKVLNEKAGIVHSVSRLAASFVYRDM